MQGFFLRGALLDTIATNIVVVYQIYFIVPHLLHLLHHHLDYNWVSHVETLAHSSTHHSLHHCLLIKNCIPWWCTHHTHAHHAHTCKQSKLHTPAITVQLQQMNAVHNQINKQNMYIYHVIVLGSQLQNIHIPIFQKYNFMVVFVKAEVIQTSICNYVYMLVQRQIAFVTIIIFTFVQQGHPGSNGPKKNFFFFASFFDTFL